MTLSLNDQSVVKSSSRLKGLRTMAFYFIVDIDPFNNIIDFLRIRN
jgi:hypothetical protein